MSNSSIWLIDRTLLDAYTPGQSGPGSNVNEGVLHIPQSSRTGTSPSDCLVLYPGHSLRRGFYPSAEMESIYSRKQADWAESLCVEVFSFISLHQNALPHVEFWTNRTKHLLYLFWKPNIWDKFFCHRLFQRGHLTTIYFSYLCVSFVHSCWR